MVAATYDLYKEQSIATMTPAELLLMLYDAAIMNTNKAIIAIKKNNIQDANKYLIKTENIILELINSLDMRYPISENLNLLYQFCYDQLVKANMRKEESILNELLPLLKELRDTWRQAAKAV